jgi:hypothetical protein
MELGARRMGAKAEEFRCRKLLAGKHVAEHAFAQGKNFLLGRRGFGLAWRLGVTGCHTDAGRAGKGAGHFSRLRRSGDTVVSWIVTDAIEFSS